MKITLVVLISLLFIAVAALAADKPNLILILADDLGNADLVAYAHEQKMSKWLKVQPGFFGPQARTAFDADYDIDGGGLPHEKPERPS
jgi:hypothetical protein